MAPPINDKQTKLLFHLYYKEKLIFGRDRLYQYVRSNYPDAAISRRQVWDWLSKQEINQLHRPHKAPKDIKSTLMTAPKQQLALDLVDMQNFALRDYKYLLNAVDLFSRKLYSVPIKNKEDSTVLAAFKEIIRETGHISSVRSDNGSEFIANVFKKYLDDQGIKQVLSKASAPQSNGAIERANQTLKRLIHKAIELEDKYDWVKNLPKLVDNINSTVVAGKGNRTANDINEGGAEDIRAVHDLDMKTKESTLPDDPFKVGDQVRHYLPSDKIKSRQWSPEIYKIVKVFKPRSSYGIYEYQLDSFTTRFKHEDLQKINGVENKLHEPERFVITKILKQIKKKGKIFYEVKWRGHRKTTVEPRENLLQDVPKMLAAFEKLA